MTKLKMVPILFWIFAALFIARLLVPLDAGAAELTAFPMIGENLQAAKALTIEASETKTRAVIFLSTKCPCSASHLSEVRSLAKDYPDVEFVGVHSNIDEPVNEAEAYFKNADLSFPVIQDTNNSIANRLQAFKTPHAFVIVKNQIVFKGGVSDHQEFKPDARKYLREALEDLKQKRSIKTPVARTLGCAIPRS